MVYAIFKGVDAVSGVYYGMEYTGFVYGRFEFLLVGYRVIVV